MTEPRPDFEQVRAQFDRICDIEDPSVQSHAAAISYSIVVPDLLAAIDDLEVVCAAWRRAASLAANDAADRKAAIDRVLALHTVVHVDVLGDRCREDWKPWPCETVRAAADG
jgi:hypothetical protein